ncbi:MAG: HAMP domain-containing histidine kinase [Ruminococcus sp.]|nr:HAMP domain-containing histidine kinase [Ruminococcus sp.]
MKTFRLLCMAVISVVLIVALIINVSLLRLGRRSDGFYRVEAKRIADEIEETGSYSPDAYPHITGVFSDLGDGRLYTSNEHYVIIEAGGTLYRAEYRSDGISKTLIAADAAFAVFFALIVWLLNYIRRHIIVPFGRLNEVPNELARGNLAVEIPEEKSRYFGRFTWGVNLLREKIEDDRRRELSMQREKKLLLLSLSHDIKTPLSAIKLSSKALARGLYTDEEKRRQTAESIGARADEIEGFVSRITKAASEDFMSFEVVQGEVFLSSVVEKLTARYAPQLSVTGTAFKVGEYFDCLLSCDPDRLAECLQNLVENAIKYGDGREIALSFVSQDGCELITVENTGCSLDPADLPQIFESFHRGANAEGIRGNGLGLFICRKLMGLMGGEAYADIKDGRFCVTLVVRMA